MTYPVSRALRMVAPLCALQAIFACPVGGAQANDTAPREDTTVVLNSKKYDLAKPDQLDAFIKMVKDLDEISKDEKKEKKAEKKADKRAKKQEEKLDENAGDKSDADAGDKHAQKADKDKHTEDAADETDPDNEETDVQAQPHKHGRDWSSSKVQHGLKAMERIADDLQQNKVDPASGIHDIQEIDWAVEHNFVTPYTWIPTLDPIAQLFRIRDVSLNACGRGSSRNPASNLTTYDAPDLSKVDPRPSTFWSRPASISDKDLYTGFDRKAIPDFTDSICTYEKSHSGYGIHPSFEVSWHGSNWKVKFGEEKSSGAFACRIFWALGFPTDVVDYTPEVKVTWDHRILSDFNRRQGNAIELKFAGIHISTAHQHGYFNPFDYIKVAVLKDGTQVPAQQLREHLFPHPAGTKMPRQPEMHKALYDKAFEDQINYLVMADASITPKDVDGVQDLGFWDYNSLGHPMLREVRAMAVLEAWLDNWDIRWGNNRLDLVKEGKGNYRLMHVVSDTGGLFGNSTGMLRKVHGRIKSGLYQNAPNDYTWVFTHSQRPGMTCVPIKDYMPHTKTAPFYLMNLDDARWMGRLIAQLTETQLKQALIGAGFDGVEARLLLEKLISRRDQMIKDLGLGSEVAALRPNGVDRQLTYNPQSGGVLEAVRPTGETVTARNSGEYVLVAGTLKENREAMPTHMALGHP